MIKMNQVKEKNYRVLSEIVGYKEAKEEISKELENNNIILLTDFLEKKGLYYDSGNNRNRYFCECGYVGDVKSSSDRPVCQKCNNAKFTTISVYQRLDSIRYLKLSHNKKLNKYTLYQVSYVVELEENDKKVNLVKKINNIFFINNDSSINLPLNSTIGRVATFDMDYFTLLSGLDIEKDIKDSEFVKGLFKDKTNINFVESSNQNIYNKLYLLLYLYINDPEIFTRWNHPLAYRMIIILINKETNWGFEVTKEKIVNIMKRYNSFEDMLKDYNIYDDFDVISKFLTSFYVQDIRNLTHIRQIQSFVATLNKDQFNLLMSLLDIFFDNYYGNLEDFLKELNLIINNDDYYKLFKEYFKSKKHIYGSMIMHMFFKDIDYCKKEKLDKSLINNKGLKLYMVSKSLIKDYNLPEEKVEAFLGLLNEDPLLAYSYIGNRRKLTKDQVEEVVKMLK